MSGFSSESLMWAFIPYYWACTINILPVAAAVITPRLVNRGVEHATQQNPWFRGKNNISQIPKGFKDLSISVREDNIVGLSFQ